MSPAHRLHKLPSYESKTSFINFLPDDSLQSEARLRSSTATTFLIETASPPKILTPLGFLMSSALTPGPRSYRAPT